MPRRRVGDGRVAVPPMVDQCTVPTYQAVARITEETEGLTRMMRTCWRRTEPLRRLSGAQLRFFQRENSVTCRFALSPMSLLAEFAQKRETVGTAGGRCRALRAEITRDVLTALQRDDIDEIADEEIRRQAVHSVARELRFRLARRTLDDQTRVAVCRLQNVVETFATERVKARKKFGVAKAVRTRKAA